MKLTRPLICLDLESTDCDPSTAAIVQFGAVILYPDGSRKAWSMDFKPWQPMTPDAERVTGRKTADFDGCPPFKDWVSQIHRGFAGKDLAGYNLMRFDLVLLDQEFRR